MSATMRALPTLAALIWTAGVITPGVAATPNSLGAFIGELERPGATDGNFFGRSVAVHGHWAAVGSQSSDYRLAPSYVYAYDFSDPQNIVRRTFVNPAVQNGSANKFGQSVAVEGS